MSLTIPSMLRHGFALAMAAGWQRRTPRPLGYLPPRPNSRRTGRPAFRQSLISSRPRPGSTEFVDC